MIFDKVEIGEKEKIKRTSKIASEIAREHFEPLYGKEQNEYIIKKTLAPASITARLESGESFYLIRPDKGRGKYLGVMSFCPSGEAMQLNDYCLYLSERSHGYGKEMFEHLKDITFDAGLREITAKVGKENPSLGIYKHLGFSVVGESKREIGDYVLDDYDLIYIL